MVNKRTSRVCRGEPQPQGRSGAFLPDGGFVGPVPEHLNMTLELGQISMTCMAGKPMNTMYCFEQFYKSRGCLFCQKRVVLTVFLRKHLYSSALFSFSFSLLLGQRLNHWLHQGDSCSSSIWVSDVTVCFSFVSFLVD